MRFLLDQANWESGISLSPDYSSIGFVMASYIAITIPFMFGSCCGLGYLALSTAFGHLILTPELESMGEFETLRSI